MTLQGWAVEDWPAVPRLAEVDPIASIEAPVVTDALERAALCASRDESRPVLTCVALYYFEDNPPCLEVVATDSYPLGADKVPVASTVRALERPLLIPASPI